MVQKVLSFLKAAFSENGNPSSSRLLSGWLSISSMALIWFYVRHMIAMPPDKMSILVSGLPYVIGALATFTVAPYGINSVTSGLTKIFKKDKDDQ